MLWSRLKARGLEGLKFRRQQPMDPYVLDFFCPEKRLAIEVDGGSHGSDEQADFDERRDQWLAERGIRVIRIAAVEIMQRLDDVMHGLQIEVSRSPDD